VPTRDYQTEQIAVHWDSARCIHTARCIQALPHVFDVNHRPWIDVTAAGADAIAGAVRRCPTGALRYTRHDGAPQEQPQKPAMAVPMPDGPLLVMGDLRIQDPEGELIAEATRVTLCRCGRSRNQPFCDNSHIAGGFRSDAFATRDAPPATGEGQTTITSTRDGSLHFEGHVVVLDPDGNELADTGDVWMCRCGNSGSKPFCDGSHRGRFTSRPCEVDGERREAETPAAFTPNPQVEPPAEVES
jgi:CDGSH-type Zn-finger protein/uncharacterized Fe-S cluster protein YjdI